MRSDEELYNQFRSGNQDALRELMERYGNLLTLYVDGILHDVHEAEDVMIESFSYIIAKKPIIRENGFKNYMYTSVRHMAFRIAKKRRIHNTFCYGEDEPETEELLENMVISDELYKVLHSCIGALKQEYREVLYFIYFENMSYEQIAKIMKRDTKQIDNFAYRGKKELKKLLLKENVKNAKY